MACFCSRLTLYYRCNYLNGTMTSTFNVAATDIQPLTLERRHIPGKHFCIYPFLTLFCSPYFGRIVALYLISS